MGEVVHYVITTTETMSYFFIVNLVFFFVNRFFITYSVHVFLLRKALVVINSTKKTRLCIRKKSYGKHLGYKTEIIE